MTSPTSRPLFSVFARRAYALLAALAPVVLVGGMLLATSASCGGRRSTTDKKDASTGGGGVDGSVSGACADYDGDEVPCKAKAGCQWCSKNEECRADTEACDAPRGACNTLNPTRCEKYPDSCVVCAAYRGCTDKGKCPKCEDLSIASDECNNAAGCDPCPLLKRCVPESACPASCAGVTGSPLCDPATTTCSPCGILNGNCVSTGTCPASCNALTQAQCDPNNTACRWCGTLNAGAGACIAKTDPNCPGCNQLGMAACVPGAGCTWCTTTGDCRDTGGCPACAGRSTDGWNASACEQLPGCDAHYCTDTCVAVGTPRACPQSATNTCDSRVGINNCTGGSPNFCTYRGYCGAVNDPYFGSTRGDKCLPTDLITGGNPEITCSAAYTYCQDKIDTCTNPGCQSLSCGQKLGYSLCVPATTPASYACSNNMRCESRSFAQCTGHCRWASSLSGGGWCVGTQSNAPP